MQCSLFAAPKGAYGERVVIILPDELGYEGLEAVTAQSGQMSNIDRLATAGMRSSLSVVANA